MNADEVLVEALASSSFHGGVALVGRVIEAGERATGLADKRVLVGALDPCGECDVCRRGGAAVCPQVVRRDRAGDRVAAAARWVVPLDGFELPLPAAAAIAGDVVLAYTLYARTGIGPREPVVIAGASPIVRFLVEILIAKAIAPVVLVDPARIEWCDHLSRRGVATATDRDGVAARFAADGIAGRSWRVIAASPDAVVQAAAVAGPRSTLTVLGPVPALPADLVTREVTVIGVAGAHPDLIVEVAAMCAKREIDLVAGTSPTETADLRAIVRIVGER